MSNEEIAHVLAVAFAKTVLEQNDNKYIFTFNSDYQGAANVLTDEYLHMYSELLDSLNKKR